MSKVLGTNVEQICGNCQHWMKLGGRSGKFGEYTADFPMWGEPDNNYMTLEYNEKADIYVMLS